MWRGCGKSWRRAACGRSSAPNRAGGTSFHEKREKMGGHTGLSEEKPNGAAAVGADAADGAGGVHPVRHYAGAAYLRGGADAVCGACAAGGAAVRRTEAGAAAGKRLQRHTDGVEPAAGGGDIGAGGL